MWTRSRPRECGAPSRFAVLSMTGDNAMWIAVLTRQDVRYLTPLLREVQEADDERAKWDTIKVQKKISLGM